MDLIDLALKYNDHAWATELMDKHEDEKKLITLFSEESIAVESVTTPYAVKEEFGIRSFNIYSDFDRNSAELVLVEQPPYSMGDFVKYYTPSNEELAYMRGVAGGYVTGYREAYREVNIQYRALLESMNQESSSNPKNQIKKRRRQQKNK